MKRVLLIYHFFYPDPVVSARLFADLAEDFAAAGHDVTVYTCNCLIRSDEKLKKEEVWNNIKIKRFSRPSFSQGSNIGRVINSFVLQLKWLCAFARMKKDFDVVILGTDPQFSYCMLPIMRLFHRRVKLIHWVFDLYPEAVLVNSPLWMRRAASLIKPFLPLYYRRVDVMADIGRCMRERVKRYHHKAQCETLTPWALVEPAKISSPDPETRKELFGDAKLGLLYSGTVGYAHDLSEFIELARQCRKAGIDAAFCFAGYGNCYKQQIAKIREDDTNIRMVGFASEEDLEKRLSAADIHLISLRPGWEGIVVPSKFFGALAIGRPVLYSGAENGDIPFWLDQFQIGQVVQSEKTLDHLRDLVTNPEKLQTLQQRAYQCYHSEFSRRIVVGRWLELLK